MKLYMLLDDGETFSPAKGCKLIAAPPEWSEEKLQAALLTTSEEIEEITLYTPSLLVMIAAQSGILVTPDGSKDAP